MSKGSPKEKALRAKFVALKEWEKGKALYILREINHIGLAARMGAIISVDHHLIENGWYEEK